MAANKTVIITHSLIGELVLILYFRIKMKNRKRQVEQSGRESGPTRRGDIPPHITLKLDGARSRFVEYTVPSLPPGMAALLEEVELTPDLIHAQVQASADRGNTPKQIEAVYNFLMSHYCSILRGETPVPLNSKYRKVPFS